MSYTTKIQEIRARLGIAHADLRKVWSDPLRSKISTCLVRWESLYAILKDYDYDLHPDCEPEVMVRILDSVYKPSTTSMNTNHDPPTEADINNVRKLYEMFAYSFPCTVHQWAEGKLSQVKKWEFCKTYTNTLTSKVDSLPSPLRRYTNIDTKNVDDLVQLVGYVITYGKPEEKGSEEPQHVTLDLGGKCRLNVPLDLVLDVYQLVPQSLFTWSTVYPSPPSFRRQVLAALGSEKVHSFLRQYLPQAYAVLPTQNQQVMLFDQIYSIATSNQTSTQTNTTMSQDTNSNQQQQSTINALKNKRNMRYAGKGVQTVKYIDGYDPQTLSEDEIAFLIQEQRDEQEKIKALKMPDSPRIQQRLDFCEQQIMAFAERLNDFIVKTEEPVK